MLSGHNIPWCSVRKVMKMEFFLPLRVGFLSSITASEWGSVIVPQWPFLDASVPFLAKPCPRYPYSSSCIPRAAASGIAQAASSHVLHTCPGQLSHWSPFPPRPLLSLGPPTLYHPVSVSYLSLGGTEPGTLRVLGKRCARHARPPASWFSCHRYLYFRA